MVSMISFENQVTGTTDSKGHQSFTAKIHYEVLKLNLIDCISPKCLVKQVRLFLNTNNNLNGLLDRFEE